MPVRGTSAAIARATPCPERAKSDRGGLFECKETIEARLPSNDNDHSSNSDLQAAAMRGLGGYSIAFDIYATREAEILSSNAAIRRAWMAMS